MQGRFVGVAVNAPGIVLRYAPLAARKRFSHLELAVLEPQVDVALRGVDPVVHRPEQAVGVAFDGALAPAVAGGDEFLRVHLQIAVVIVHQPDVRRLGDEDAVLEDLHGARHHEPVGKHRAAVHLPVAIGVLEHDNAADGVLIGLRKLEVAEVGRHFDHPQASFGIPLDRDGIADQGLARHQFQVIARRHVDGLQRFLRGERRRLRGHLLQRRRKRAIAGRGLRPAGGDDDAGEQREGKRLESNHGERGG